MVLPLLVPSAMTQHPGCDRLLARALRCTPGGAQTMSKRASQFPAGYPAFIERGSGARVWCPDGHEYVDWICGLGAMTLGYGHPAVDAAVFRQLARGVSFSLAHRLEVEVAEQLVGMIPCAKPDGMVRWVKTGSEATEGAVRVARMVTGRERIIVSGYHCYSDDTELLTAHGFKPFRSLRVGEFVATRNPTSGMFEYERVLEVIDELHFGKMLHVTGPGLDLLVTPEHRMIRSQKPDCLALELTRGDTLPLTASWLGVTPENLTIRRRTSRECSRKDRTKGRPTKGIVRFPAAEFMRFIGWFISEGWCQRHRRARYEIHLAQNPGILRERMLQAIRDLGFVPRESGPKIIFSSKELWYFLRQCGQGANKKRVPERLKQLGPDLLRVLLEALIDGDGTRSGGRLAFYTTSPRLADDVQEIACKIGMATTRTQHINRGGVIAGKLVRSRKPIIHVRFPERVAARVTNITHQQWMGRIVCARTKNGQLFVRRNGLALWCGNSWHSWYAASRPEHPGVPASLAKLVSSFAHNDLGALDLALTGWDSPPAAVMLEPAMNAHPEPGFLGAVVDLAHAVGALVIFDEMITGFRWASGGAQAFYGVTPDLAVFGKGLANGYPLACVVGPRAMMDPAALVISGTFGGETLSLAAAGAVLDIFKAEPVTQRMAHSGNRLVDAINAAARDLGVPLVADGPGPRVILKGERRLVLAFCQQAAARGLLLHPAGNNVSGVLTEADQDLSERAAQEAVAALAKGATLEGPEPSEGFAATARREQGDGD